MNACVRQSVAQFCITTVSRRGSNGISWVEVFDGECNIFCSFGILAKILDHKLGKVKILFVTTFVDLCFLNSQFFSHNFSIIVNQALFSTFGHYNHTVSFRRSNFDNMLINSFWTIKLEVHFRDETNVNVTSGKSGKHRNVSTVASHEPNNTNSIFS